MFWPHLGSVENKPKQSAPRQAAIKTILDPNAVGCDSCTLRSLWGTITTPRMKLSGNVNGDVLVLAEAPGEQEDLQGKPLVGPSGKLLREHIPFKFKDRVAFQNTVRCRPH